MRYVIREKFWSWGDDFHIRDEHGQPVFFIAGKAFSWGDNLSFQDLEGNELASIHQKLLTWKPKYDIHRNGQLIAEVVKESSWTEQSFTMDVPGPNDYVIEGEFWRHEYRFLRGGREAARVCKANWTGAGSYGVEIAPGEDEVAILCAAIVIDQVLHDENKE